MLEQSWCFSDVPFMESSNSQTFGAIASSKAASPRGLLPASPGHGRRRRAPEQRDARAAAPGADAVPHGDLPQFRVGWASPRSHLKSPGEVVEGLLLAN